MKLPKFVTELFFLIASEIELPDLAIDTPP